MGRRVLLGALFDRGACGSVPWDDGGQLVEQFAENAFTSDAMA
jgi:hypothetical protein